MNIKQMLFNIYGQEFRRQNLEEIQRKNINCRRNQQKKKIVEENSKISQTCNWLRPADQRINKFTMNYLQSHHPSIKKRVVKILSNHRQENLRRPQNKIDKYSLVEQLKMRSKTIHSEKSNITQSNPQTYNEDNKFYDPFIQISKTCKMSVRTLTKRSQTQQRQPKSRQCHCEAKKDRLMPKKARVQTANIYNRMPIKNNSFTAWEIDISTNGSFLH